MKYTITDMRGKIEIIDENGERLVPCFVLFRECIDKGFTDQCQKCGRAVSQREETQNRIIKFNNILNSIDNHITLCNECYAELLKWTR